jgi:hypothetical protein
LTAGYVTSMPADDTEERRQQQERRSGGASHGHQILPVASGRSCWCRLAVTRIDCLNRFNGKQQQGIERAGTMTRSAIGAMSANVTMEAFDVGVDGSASRQMRNLDDLGKMKFDPAVFAHWTAGRSSRRTVDAAAAHLLPDFGHVLVKFCLCVHRAPSFPAGGNCRINRHLYNRSKSNAGLVSATVCRLSIPRKGSSVQGKSVPGRAHPRAC